MLVNADVATLGHILVSFEPLHYLTRKATKKVLCKRYVPFPSATQKKGSERLSIHSRTHLNFSNRWVSEATDALPAPRFLNFRELLPDDRTNPWPACRQKNRRTSKHHRTRQASIQGATNTRQQQSLPEFIIPLIPLHKTHNGTTQSLPWPHCRHLDHPSGERPSQPKVSHSSSIPSLTCSLCSRLTG